VQSKTPLRVFPTLARQALACSAAVSGSKWFAARDGGANGIENLAPSHGNVPRGDQTRKRLLAEQEPYLLSLYAALAARIGESAALAKVERLVFRANGPVVGGTELISIGNRRVWNIENQTPGPA
jgi:hypothetical protein